MNQAKDKSKEFVTSRSDRAFKYVFLDENDLSLLEEFLSRILNRSRSFNCV